ncbi:MAG TPA: MFS transporter, partial [Phycisphaeraceae bacterium]
SDAGVQASAVTAGVTFFFFLPYLAMMAPAGWLADRLPRKWIMLACDEGRAAVLLLAFALVPAGVAGAVPASHHWKVFALIAAVGALAAVFNPARNATIPQIVPPAQLQRANALTFGIAVIASLLGLLIGGRLISRYSPAAGLLTAVLAYAVSGTFFAFIKPVSRRRPPGLGRDGALSLTAGLRYVCGHRGILQLIILDAVIWGAANLTFAALAALGKQRYGFTEPEAFLRGFGDLSAAAGTGMLVSALVVGWMNFRRESHWFLLLALAGAGACMTALAISHAFPAGLALVFLIGFLGNAAMVCVGTLLQSISPNYIRGRIFAINSLVSTLSAVAINLAIWRMPHADAWTIPAVGAAGVTLAVIGVWGAWRELGRGPMDSPMASALWRLLRWYVLVWHRLRWVGRDRIPATGAVILAPNHTTGLDPLLIQAGCPRPVRWVMLTEYQFRLAAPLWRTIQPIALDRRSGDLGKIRQIVQTLQDGQVVGLFPEGGLQRTHRQLKPFQPGVAMVAQRSSAAIVPVWISGTPRRQNMLWHFLQPSRSVVIYGKPFYADPQASHQQVLDDLRRRMLELADSIDPPLTVH